jgi:hypothetical protein
MKIKWTSIEWFSNQTYELFEQYSEGRFDRITLNKLMLKATKQAKEMHSKELELAYQDGKEIEHILNTIEKNKHKHTNI